MISGVIQKRYNFCLCQGIAPNPTKGNKHQLQGAIARKFAHLTIGFATAGMMTIAIAQPAVAQASAPHSTCAADAHGLMCNASNHELKEDAVQAPQTTAALLSQPLSNTQMERVADILLGLLYFVLPVGFGVGLFWHDRQQAQRTATLEAQIKLLEKLWKQSPQA